MESGKMTADYLPAFGVCGWSGSGKTSVIEEVTRRLTDRKLNVAVIKHDVHGLSIDHEGKDSDRFFKAGADVIMRGPKQSFLRAHRTGDSPLLEVLELVCPYYDVILVEGHKSTPAFSKVWVLKDDNDECPPETTNVKCVLKRSDDRVKVVMEMLDAWLPEVWSSTPLYAGVLVGGSSNDGHNAGQIHRNSGKLSVERAVDAVRPFVDGVTILGTGELPDSLRELPVLPDVKEAKGPIAGMLAAMRWRPLTSWLFVASDLPHISRRAVEWLVSTRVPGVWSTMPRLADAQGVEPLLAHYDFRSHPLLEKSSTGPSEIAGSPKVLTPTPPADVAEAWTHATTSADSE